MVKVPFFGTGELGPSWLHVQTALSDSIESIEKINKNVGFPYCY